LIEDFWFDKAGVLCLLPLFFSICRSLLQEGEYLPIWSPHCYSND